MVTDSFIYFYEFDEEDETMIPQKQYVMSNFMECIQLMFNNDQNICVTYKSGQPNFSVYKRKYDHGFREIIDATSREGCRGVNIPSKHVFIISDDNYF